MTVITTMFWFAVVVCTATGATIIGLGILDLRKSKYLRPWFRISVMIFAGGVILSLFTYPVVRAFQ